MLTRWGGHQGLAPLLANLPDAPTFDAALRATYHVTEGDFERRWHRDLGSRYGWLSWAGALGFFWLAIGSLVVVLVVLRRRRDRAKRAALEALPDVQILDEHEIKE